MWCHRSGFHAKVYLGKPVSNDTMIELCGMRIVNPKAGLQSATPFCRQFGKQFSMMACSNRIR